MPAVICHLGDEREVAEAEFQNTTEEINVQFLAEGEHNKSEIARNSLWLLKSGRPDAKKVDRIIGRLRGGQLIDWDWQLTELGQEKLKKHLSKNAEHGPNGKCPTTNGQYVGIH